MYVTYRTEKCVKINNMYRMFNCSNPGSVISHSCAQPGCNCTATTVSLNSNGCDTQKGIQYQGCTFSLYTSFPALVTYADDDTSCEVPIIHKHMLTTLHNSNRDGSNCTKDKVYTYNRITNALISEKSTNVCMMENGVRVKYFCGFEMDSSAFKLQVMFPLVLFSLFFILFQ
jgi:hypothetical protein